MARVTAVLTVVDHVVGSLVEHAVAAHMEVVHMVVSLADLAEVVPMVAVPMVAALTVVVLTATAVIAKSEFQHSYLCIHHASNFAHWFSIIYCLDGLVNDSMAYSQHLLSWECLLDIGDEFSCPGKQVF